MRYDSEHKERTRLRVLKEAGRAIRAQGPHRLAVADIMSRAGLTHGGFYAHFASKEALVAEALDQTFVDARASFDGLTRGLEPEPALAAYLSFYLSEEHRDSRATGCPVAALANDLPRMEADFRHRYAVGVARLTTRLADLLAAAGRPEPEALAGSAVAELVGALSLARAVADPVQSSLILRRSRDALSARLGLETAP